MGFLKFLLYNNNSASRLLLHDILEYILSKVFDVAFVVEGFDVELLFVEDFDATSLVEGFYESVDLFATTCYHGFALLGLLQQQCRNSGPCWMPMNDISKRVRFLRG